MTKYQLHQFWPIAIWQKKNEIRLYLNLGIVDLEKTTNTMNGEELYV